MPLKARGRKAYRRAVKVRSGKDIGVPFNVMRENEKRFGGKGNDTKWKIK